MTATVAILGRPNVGKSTLFNRLTAGTGPVDARGKPKPTATGPALAHPVAGTTRDVRRHPAELFGLTFTLLDTAGVEQGRGQTELQGQLNTLALAAAAQADLLLLIIDGASGLLPADRALAQAARKTGKPVIVLLNKADLKTAAAHAADVETLGFGAPILIAAAHNQGLDALHEALLPHIPRSSGNPPPITHCPSSIADSSPIPLAILGRPNTGKSTLTNALLRREAMLTGPTAGLTREAIAHDFTYKNVPFTLIDTPGLRRKSKVEKEGVEFLSVGQTLQAADNAQIVILVVDASEHNVGKGKWQILEQQDAQIAAMVMARFKPLVIALSKWDLVENPVACMEDVQTQLHHRFHDIHTPLAVPLSSIQGKGIKTLLEAVLKVNNASRATFSTNKLNNLLAKTLAKKSPPLANGRVVSLKFIRQTGSYPPSFTFWGNRINQVSNSYKQFLRHQLAQTLGLQNIPIRIFFRANANPFQNKKTTKS